MMYEIRRVDRPEENPVRRCIISANDPKQALVYHFRSLELGNAGKRLVTYTRVSNRKHRAECAGAVWEATLYFP